MSKYKSAPRVLYGQEIVYDLLIRAGGKATVSELIKLGEIHYPGNCNNKNMADRLNKLCKWQRVTRYYDKKAKKHYWEIVNEQKT